MSLNLGPVLEYLEYFLSSQLINIETLNLYNGIVCKNTILDGCSTVDSKLDYDGIEWYSMVFCY